MTFGFFAVFGLLAMLAMLAGGLALLPALLVIGAVVLALSLAFHVIGFVFRLFGWLVLALFAIPLALAAGCRVGARARDAASGAAAHRRDRRCLADRASPPQPRRAAAVELSRRAEAPKFPVGAIGSLG